MPILPGMDALHLARSKLLDPPTRVVSGWPPTGIFGPRDELAHDGKGEVRSGRLVCHGGVEARDLGAREAVQRDLPQLRNDVQLKQAGIFFAGSSLEPYDPADS